MRKLKKTLSIIGSWLYFPIYVVFWLLHKVARILLAFAYAGMLQPNYSANILTHLFFSHGRRKGE